MVAWLPYPGGGTLSLALSGVVSSNTLLDVYGYTTGERTFLAELTVASGDFFGSLPVSGVGAGSQIVATRTVIASLVVGFITIAWFSWQVGRSLFVG